MTSIEYTAEDLRDHDAIAAVIKDSEGRVLMQDHVKFGFWTIPIGKAQQGQSPEDALCKELLEECAIKVTRFRKLAQQEYVYDRAGAQVRLTSHVFEVLTYEGTIRNNEPHKHRHQTFVDLAQIKRLSYVSDATLLYLASIGYDRPARLG